MKKTALLAALCSVVSLSSCCRIVDCCFEDPCAPIQCSPCESKKKDVDGGCNSCNGYVPACKPCGGDTHQDAEHGPQAREIPVDGKCRQQVAQVKSLPTTDVVSKEVGFLTNYFG